MAAILPRLRLAPPTIVRGPFGSSRRPSSSRLAYSTSSKCFDSLAEHEKQLNPREIIERKRKDVEQKYGDKLRRKIEAEGVRDLEALKVKKLAPSVKAAIKAKKVFKSIAEEPATEVALSPVDLKPAPDVTETRKTQPQGDRAGIKPLSSILNLPLLHMTPHDADAIAKIWTAYHSAHPTLSASFLSAYLPTLTYTSMLHLARANPFFVLPLPRDVASNENGAVETDEYEMFYLQWLFHPTSTSSSPPSPEASPTPLPLTSSVIFTPLEEFKQAGEWAQPQLVLTHYPELAQSHDLVLMRGEITAATAAGPAGSLANPGFLLSQPQAQLLALALQRFYCADIAPRNESAKDAEDRGKRKSALRGFSESPGEWDWSGLVGMAYAGLM